MYENLPFPLYNYLFFNVIPIGIFYTKDYLYKNIFKLYRVINMEIEKDVEEHFDVFIKEQENIAKELKKVQKWIN
ncbi:hypothetical protein CMO93_03890 [Candidatus Woesearchaeota archaeon]|nr:hypothetical protein [Candidatus Woesearchaeota archaeon]|tara:strand:+ start:1201 stop:1425 length:225 start_codon:yes stop_codon:yes gene_type:complete